MLYNDYKKKRPSLLQLLLLPLLRSLHHDRVIPPPMQDALLLGQVYSLNRGHFQRTRGARENERSRPCLVRFRFHAQELQHSSSSTVYEKRRTTNGKKGNPTGVRAQLWTYAKKLVPAFLKLTQMHIHLARPFASRLARVKAGPGSFLPVAEPRRRAAASSRRRDH